MLRRHRARRRARCHSRCRRSPNELQPRILDLLRGRDTNAGDLLQADVGQLVLTLEIVRPLRAAEIELVPPVDVRAALLLTVPRIAFHLAALAKEELRDRESALRRILPAVDQTAAEGVE